MNKEPKGTDLLALLIDLLADQEGVKITYELTEEKKDVQRMLPDPLPSPMPQCGVRGTSGLLL